METYGQTTSPFIQFSVELLLSLSEKGISSSSSKPSGGAAGPMLAITLARVGLRLQPEPAVKRLSTSEPKRLHFEGWVWGNLS